MNKKYCIFAAQFLPHMGGIENYNDGLEFIMAGASLISIGSGIFANPILPIEVIEGIENYLKENNIDNIKDLIGIAHKMK